MRSNDRINEKRDVCGAGIGKIGETDATVERDTCRPVAEKVEDPSHASRPLDGSLIDRCTTDVISNPIVRHNNLRLRAAAWAPPLMGTAMY